MLNTPGEPEDYQGAIPAASPTVQEKGIFSFCSGGVPVAGAFGRLPGKTMRYLGVFTTGGVMSIYDFGKVIVVQVFTGLLVFPTSELAPVGDNFVYDNFGNLVYDNSGIAVTQ